MTAAITDEWLEQMHWQRHPSGVGWTIVTESGTGALEVRLIQSLDGPWIVLLTEGCSVPPNPHAIDTLSHALFEILAARVRESGKQEHVVVIPKRLNRQSDLTLLLEAIT